jgi:hypothetical protein
MGPPADGQGIAEYYGWTPSTDGEAVKRALADEFPDWSIIRTRDTGRWWAVRDPAAEPRWQGDDVTEVDANTPEVLRTRLREAGA